MYCQSCGTQMNEDARFCPKCGRGATTAPVGAAPTDDSAGAATAPAAPADPNLGRTVEGKYRIDSKLGAGGMGTVYRATRLLIGDTVALKVLRPETTSDPQAIERFRREAQAAARLKHPNVVVIHDFGVASGNLVYLVMELADGEDLRSFLGRSGRLAPAIASELMDQICSALEEAHERNIVHRDLKPENILVRQMPNGYRVKVLDFGIAKLRDLTTGSGASTLTQVGTVMGTPYYMSPEQCLGREVDSRSDIYSLGVILYEMLTGATPFNASTASALVVQHVNDAPPPPRLTNPSVPVAVEGVVLRALQKSADARPQTAAAFARELAEAVRAAGATQPTAPAPPVATTPVHTFATDPRTPPAPAPQTMFEPPRQSVPPYGQWAPPPSPSSGVPAVVKVVLGFALLAVGVGVGFLAKYLIEDRTTPAPTPPPVIVAPAPAPAPKRAEAPAPNTNAPPAAGPKYARISNTKVTLRDRPSIRGAALTLLSANDRVEILGSQENPSDKEGVLSRDAQFESENGGGSASLPQGRGVYILGEDGGEYYVETTDSGRTIRGYVDKGAVRFAARTWYKVRGADGQTGWVNSQFISIE